MAYFDRMEQTELEKARAKAEKDLAEIRAIQKQRDELAPDKRLATDLHAMFCGHNHTDGCGWYYDSWEKFGTNSERYRWLDKARRLLKTNVPVEKIMEILRIAR